MKGRQGVEVTQYGVTGLSGKDTIGRIAGILVEVLYIVGSNGLHPEQTQPRFVEMLRIIQRRVVAEQRHFKLIIVSRLHSAAVQPPGGQSTGQAYVRPPQINLA